MLIVGSIKETVRCADIKAVPYIQMCRDQLWCSLSLRYRISLSLGDHHSGSSYS
jgi:hypothetical protein